MNEMDIREKLRREYYGRFVMFGRNGRWGTCVDCPRDALGNVYPELCENTDRYDHNLTLGMLVGNYNHTESRLRSSSCDADTVWG